MYLATFLVFWFIIAWIFEGEVRFMYPGVLWGTFLVLTAIQGALHLRHLKIARTFKLGEVRGPKIEVSVLGSRRVISLSDIAEIEKHVSYNADRGDLQWYPWEKYWYYRIFLEDGTIIYLSCLQDGIERLEVLFRNIKKVRSVYCYPDNLEAQQAAGGDAAR